MSTTSYLEITMLGEFSITNQDKSLSDRLKHSKKCIYLLEYLIAHRHSQVTQNELIELLWPEETSDNPIGALKTLLHRVRSLLREIGLPKESILQTNHNYSWNNLVPTKVDTEELESLAKQIKFTKDKQQLISLYSQVCTLYKGDFLPQMALEPWVVPINAYYHSLFLKLINEYIELLMNEHDYTSISTICCSALNIDNFDEDLHYYYILALHRLGKTTAALDQFTTSSKLLQNKYNVPLSERFLTLHKEIRQPSPSHIHDIYTIQNNLTTYTNRQTVLLCDYSQFEAVYQLETISCSRLEETLLLGLITLSNRIRSVTSSTIAKAMDTLSECFLHTLSSRDVVAKYSNNQFVLLLPAITKAEGQSYLKKISTDFSKTSFRSLIQLECSLVELKNE